MRPPHPVTLSLLIFMLAGCNQPVAQGPSVPVIADAGQGPEQTPAMNETPAETAVEEETVADEVPTLDGILPEELSIVTAPWTGDLDGMVERRIIRTLVASGGPQFFYYQGKPRGIMAEMLGLFQNQLNVGLDRRLDQVEIMPMPTSRDRMIPALLNGEADLVATDLTVTDERSALVDFSVPIGRGVSEVVVFAPGRGQDVTDLDGLSGETLYVRRSSSYHEHLTTLAADMEARGIEPLRITEANEHLRTQDILQMVNAGLVGATVIDSWKADYWSALLEDMQVRHDLVIKDGGVIAWAFRKNSPQLAEAVNDFVRGHRAGTLIGNVLINRYMENLGWVQNSTSERGYERIRPLLELFLAAGAETGIDPLMLAAQAYQESGLDHERVSPAGAVGLMQVKPSTAADRNVGIPDISTPAENVRAGARYMRFLMDHYFSGPGIDPMQSWIFALAAYNAGPARIQRLRNQAAAEGHDPDVWVENVELIAARKIGRETVRYVRNVFKYYVAYRMSSEEFAEWRSLDVE